MELAACFSPLPWIAPLRTESGRENLQIAAFIAVGADAASIWGAAAPEELAVGRGRDREVGVAGGAAVARDHSRAARAQVLAGEAPAPGQTDVQPRAVVGGE